MHSILGRAALCFAATGAFLVLPSRTAHAAGVSVEAASEAQAGQASEKYRAGMEAFEGQKFEVALGLFRESYDIVASPNSHLMIGRTLAKMGKVAEAYGHIESSIREARAAAEKSEKYRKTLSAAMTEREELKSKVGFVVVELGGEVSLAGRTLASTEMGQPIAVDPGTTEVVLKLASGEEVREKVDVQPGQETKVGLAPHGGPAGPATPCAPTMAPAEPAQAGINQKTLALVTGGVAVAGFATFGVFGYLDNKAYSDLQDSCANDICARSKSSDAEKGRTYQTIANVGLGVGAAFAVTSLLLYFTAPSGSVSVHTGGTAPTLAVGPGHVALRGRF